MRQTTNRICQKHLSGMGCSNRRFQKPGIARKGGGVWPMPRFSGGFDKVIIDPQKWCAHVWSGLESFNLRPIVDEINALFTSSFLELNLDPDILSFDYTRMIYSSGLAYLAAWRKRGREIRGGIWAKTYGWFSQQDISTQLEHNDVQFERSKE